MNKTVQKILCAVMALTITCTIFGCAKGSDEVSPNPNPPMIPETDREAVILPNGPSELKEGTFNIFVDADAKDGGNGSEENPFKTLKQARDYVRTVNSDTQKDIYIYIREGVYFQNESLVLNEQDSAPTGKRIVWSNYPNEHPVISGGLKIENWRFADGLYEAKIDRNLPIRNFFVNGERKQRASKRASGLFLDGDAYKIYDKSDFADMATWNNLQDIELVLTLNWKMFRIGIDRVENGVVYPNEQQWAVGKTAGQFGIHNASLMRIENAMELLDEENEWYYNSATGKIYYKPRSDEKLRSCEVIVPITEGLLKMNDVSNVTIRGLSFMYDAWNFPSTQGYLENQAGVISRIDRWGEAYKTPGSISVSNGHNVEISENHFKGLGINALAIDRGSKDVAVKSNYIEDISGAGISVADIQESDKHQKNESLITERILLENNVIERVGAEYWSVPGIIVGFARNITISQNTLRDLPYTAISMGWGWGAGDPSVCEHNRVIGNKIYRFMNKLNDGGGIYTLGEQPNSVIAGNYLACHMNDYAYLYLDNGSAHFTVYNNVVESNYGEDYGRCAHWGFVTQYAPHGDYLLAHNNLVRDNWYKEGMDMFQWKEASENVQKNNVKVPMDTQWPEEAQKVIDESGSALIQNK